MGSLRITRELTQQTAKCELEYRGEKKYRIIQSQEKQYLSAQPLSTQSEFHRRTSRERRKNKKKKSKKKKKKVE